MATRALAVAIAMLVPVSAVRADDMSFDLNEAEGSTDQQQQGQQQQGQQQQGQQQGELGDVVGNLAAEDQQTQVQDREGPRVNEHAEEIYAIQRVYALRLHRFELQPNVAFNLNDPYQGHLGLGMAANYWITNVLAVGANFLWYDFGHSSQESDTSFFTRRSTRLGIPLNQWQTGAWLNFTYVPLYGKFSAFNRFIFQWDAYIIGGVGFMRTRPIPVFDPLVRSFDWGTRVSFNAGLGVRIFLSRWLAAFFEFRDYIFLERYENTTISPDPAQRTSRATWLQSGSTVTNNASIGVGFTFFLPPTFQYRLPK